MQNEDLVAANEFCSHYHIEYSFITSLQQFGLIDVTTIQETGFIPTSELQKLEKLIRLHYDLDINLEGIEAITFLLQKVENMQQEITALRNRLRLYETPSPASGW